MNSLERFKDCSSSIGSDESRDLDVTNWLDETHSPTPGLNNKGDELCDSISTNSILSHKSRGVVIVKPDRVATWLTSLFPTRTTEKTTSFDAFKQQNTIPKGLTSDEVFFVYCHLHDDKKWKITAKIDNIDDDNMKELRAVRKYGPYHNEKSHLPSHEIERRLLKLADEIKCGNREIPSDHILYVSMETDDALVETYTNELRQKRSRDVADIARWLIVLREAREGDVKVESFKEFQETFPELQNQITEYEQFVLYGLVYSPPQWKVLLETNSRDSVYGVYIVHKSFPEYTTHHPMVSQVTVLSLIHI